MTRLIVAFVATTLAASITSAQTPDPVTFSGEFQLEQFFDGRAQFTGRIELRGRIEAPDADWHLVADQVDFFNGEQRIEASGNVEFTLNGNCRISDQVTIDLSGPMLRLYSGLFRSGNCTRQ